MLHRLTHGHPPFPDELMQEMLRNLWWTLVIAALLLTASMFAVVAWA